MNQFRENCPLLLLYFCCILATCVAVNCANDQDVLKEQMKCFTDQGIDFAMPDFSKQITGEQLRNMWVEALIIESRELCQRREAYQMALECDAMISLGCIPADQRQLIRDDNSLKLLLPAVCSDFKNVNFECAAGRLQNLLACGAPDSYPANRTGNLASKNEAACQLFESNRICQINILMECGCNAVRVMDLVLRELIQPKTCPSVDGGPVDCDTANIGFIGSNSNQLAHHVACTVFFWVLSIVLEY